MSGIELPVVITVGTLLVTAIVCPTGNPVLVELMPPLIGQSIGLLVIYFSDDVGEHFKSWRVQRPSHPKILRLMGWLLLLLPLVRLIALGMKIRSPWW